MYLLNLELNLNMQVVSYFRQNESCCIFVAYEYRKNADVCDAGYFPNWIWREQICSIPLWSNSNSIEMYSFLHRCKVIALN